MHCGSIQAQNHFIKEGDREKSPNKSGRDSVFGLGGTLLIFGLVKRWLEGVPKLNDRLGRNYASHCPWL